MRLTAFLGFVFLAACSSLPNDFAYNSTDNEALLIHQVDGKEYYIGQVDLERKTSFGKAIRLGNGSTVYSKYIERKFGVKKVVPGLYAVIEGTSGPGMSGRYYKTCYKDAAPVFRLKSGTINVLPTFMSIVEGSAFENDKILDEVSRGLGKIEGVVGEPVYVEFLGFVDISKKKNEDKSSYSC